MQKNGFENEKIMWKFSLSLSPRSIAVVQPHQRVHQKLTEFWSTMASPSTPQLFFPKYFYSSFHLFDFWLVWKWYVLCVRLCLSFLMIQVLKFFFVFVLWCCSLVFPTVCHDSFSFNVLVALMVPWVLVVTLVWSQFLHCRGLHTLFSHPTVPNRHTIPFCHYWLIFCLFLRIFLDVLHKIFQKVFLFCCYYYCLHTTFSHSPVSNFYKVPLCHISIICFYPSKYFWTYFTWIFEAVFSLSKKYLKSWCLSCPYLMLLFYPLLPSASKKAKWSIKFTSFAILQPCSFLWGKFDLCRLHALWDLIISLIMHWLCIAFISYSVTF